MTDISTLVGGPSHISRQMGGQRARVVKPPASLGASLTVTLVAYTDVYEYEVPGTNWVSRGTALPVKGTVGVAVFDDFGDVWFLVGGGTEFPAGDGGTETDPIASAALTAHAADTTGIHGIADTSLLVVTSDTRLTNARTPSGAAGGVLGGTYPNPSFAADMATQAELDAHAIDTTAVHGIADTTALVFTGDARLTNARTPTAHHTTHEPGGTDAMAVDAAAATGSLRTLGTGAAQAAPGNDARLSDQRVPTDGSVTNAKVAAAAAIARSKLDFGSGLVNVDIAAAAAIAKSKLAALAIVDADVNAAAAIAESKLALATDAAAGTGSRRTLGTTATSAAAGNRGLPVGGATGQVLSKNSATDYDVGWAAAGGSFSPGTKTAISFTANFASAGPQYVPKMRKDSAGVVWLEGLVTNTAALSVTNTIVFTLPSGFRPVPPAGQTTTERYFTVWGNGNRTAYINIDQAGNCHFLAPISWAINSFFSLDQVHFDSF